MILADKIMTLRKRAGWSQEELAQRLDVSRQSVSKWESAQAIPDLGRILALAQLFDVTTDFLLKDAYGDEMLPPIQKTEADTPTVPQDPAPAAASENAPALRRVTMEEAGAFLGLAKKYAPITAIAAMLYILSPVPLLVMGGLTERPSFAAYEDLFGVLGIVILLVIVAIATVMVLGASHAEEPYEFLEDTDIDTDYGVDGMARDFREKHETGYRFGIAGGIVLCIVGAIPCILLGLLPEAWGLGGAAVGITLLLIGDGVRMIVHESILHEATEKLLEDGDYTREKKYKKRTSRAGNVSVIYWLCVTAIFLCVGFVWDSWGRTWVIWPIAGVLYAVFLGIWELIEAGNGKK